MVSASLHGCTNQHVPDAMAGSARKVAILQSTYLPWKGYFDLIHDVDIFIFYDTAKYTKNDWRNRNIIYTANGKQWLTVPIAADAVNLPINEVRFLDGTWREKHLKSLRYGYKRAKYFSNLEELIEEFYNKRDWARLSDFNQAFIQHVSRQLEIKTIFKRSDGFSIEGDRIGKLINLVKAVGGTSYLSGPAARDYLQGNEHRFSDAGLDLQFKSYLEYPAYTQLRELFEPNVSIVDLIANVGWKAAPDYIWRFKSG